VERENPAKVPAPMERKLERLLKLLNRILLPSDEYVIL
jgi:hypothetical protein